MTGAELRAARLERGWAQRELARRAGLAHRTIQYWEAKREIDPFAHAMKAIAKAMGWPTGKLRDQYARARGGVLQRTEAERLLAYFAPHLSASFRKRLANHRMTCGARTRKGEPCRAKSEPGKRRCRFHGGMSTGPRSQEGRERIAEAQRKRWATYRRQRLTRAVTATRRQGGG